MLVVADNQTNARGQMGTKWLSEGGKNLTFSMFIRIKDFSLSRQFELNQAVSLGLLEAIKKYAPNLKIKWPNDILADTKKIAGILIENTVSKNSIKHSIIGVGLNVNQTEFPVSVPNAVSIKQVLKKELDLEVLLDEIVDSIKHNIARLEVKEYNLLRDEYLQNMYLYNEKAIFIDKNNKSFEGKIVGLTTEARILVEMQSTEIVSFGFKEIQFF